MELKAEVFDISTTLRNHLTSIVLYGIMEVETEVFDILTLSNQHLTSIVLYGIMEVETYFRWGI